MYIEKLSDNQVKFTLNKTDLLERNIKIAELAYGSEKTQELFREMMNQATIECGFRAENIPLMIEAIPVSPDSIIIIVTKVTSSEEIENRFNIFKNDRDTSKSKTKKSNTVKDDVVKYENNIAIYSFETLDDVSVICNRLNDIFNGTSFIYKYCDSFYLLLENNNPLDNLSDENLDSILSEYGNKHISTVISKFFLKEHGELFVKDPAITTFYNYY